MSEAGISDEPNREDSTFPEAQAAPAEATAVARFEQRIAGSGTRVSSTPDNFPRLREADWFSLARKLRQRNRDLLKKVASLEQSLAETQEALQNEVARSRSSDTLNAQQAKNLQTARAKIATLYRELETSSQTHHQHRTSVEQLSNQLEEAGRRIAELDRECTALRQRYDEQSQDLEVAQQKTHELSARLERQQRRTLQFKAALDKCLEEGTPTPPLNRDRAVVLELPTRKPQPTHSTRQESDRQHQSPDLPATSDSETAASHTQPIQPWSYQERRSEVRGDRLPLWANKTVESDRVREPDEEESPAIAAEIFEPTLQKLSNPDPNEHLITDSVSFENFERLQPIEWEVEPSETDTFDAMFEIVDLLVEPLPEEMPDEELGLQEVVPAIDRDSTDNSTVSPSPKKRSLEAIAPPQSNFPAPLVYPHRNQRKHNSLASIELPKFLS
ncbi:MAG: hypothetical protein SW833_13375 [Cyanobacteriota bacterium]|nr:hypothetical protein [Cyanobacteriota bacterium]